MRNASALALVGLLAAACSDSPPPLAPAGVAAPTLSRATTHRPVEDFLASSRNCPVAWLDPETGDRTVVVDFWDFFASRARAGLLPASLGEASYSGSVRERPLADGSVEVTVRVHVRDAFVSSRLIAPGDLNGPAIFGYLSSEVAAGATPVLGSGTFWITYVVPEAGAPLPDFCDVLFDEGDAWRISKLQMTASAVGPLRATFGVPEGTPGRLNITSVERQLARGGEGIYHATVNIRPSGR